MQFFVEKKSIVRKIWGKPDTVLLIFAGAAAEFALNKAVDWLYFTGMLPADPIGRLFSTVSYAGKIIFSEQEDAFKTIDSITAIHAGVENKRGKSIPDWAYRDVLYMLMHYSISSFEVLERKLTTAEKDEVYNVFYRFGSRMNITELPSTYNEWLHSRANHLEKDLVLSDYSLDLFKQYKKHLGTFRYYIFVESQKMVVPPKVLQLLGFPTFSSLSILLPLYKFSRLLRLDGFIKSMILPRKYKAEIKALPKDV
ncbi:MAG: oxygenase MpaB family protein [Ferruginibacter sp.]